jgi:hypothetical protein
MFYLNLNRRFIGVALVCACAGIAVAACSGEDVSNTKVEESLTQIPFNQVTLTDNFWLPRLQIQKKTRVPFSLEKTEPAVENLRRVGAYLRGEKVTEQFTGP